MPELLAPAGNLEKLKVAAAFGADAVYFGLDRFSLRSYAGNFSMNDAETGLTYLHTLGKKGYAALNIYPFEQEYQELVKSALELSEIGIDGLIIADLGVFFALKKAGVKVPLHISTQANTVSPQTVSAWRDLGASRVNLARELSFEQIASLQQAVSGIETEVFVHGAVCFSYSGRCAISDYLTGRRANRGECTHPCRWQYSLVEEKRPGEYMPVKEDNRGLYFFNSKELALFPWLSRLSKVGVASFKIEGRMKSIHYLAGVVSLYRRVLDGYELNEEDGFRLLGRIMSRGYSYGFMKGAITEDDYRFDNSAPYATSKFLGIIIPKQKEDTNQNRCLLDVRNQIIAGEQVEYLTPAGEIGMLSFPEYLETVNGEILKEAHHTKILSVPFCLPDYSIIRRVHDHQ